VIVGLVLGRFTVGQVWNVPNSSVLVVALFWSVGALLWAIREVWVIWKLVDELRYWRFGLRGEQAVGEKLMDRELAAAGYVAFHDLPAEEAAKSGMLITLSLGLAEFLFLRRRRGPGAGRRKSAGA